MSDLEQMLSTLRGKGWTVAVHNDYRQDGELRTFWLFTRGNVSVKGEGPADQEAEVLTEIMRHPLVGGAAPKNDPKDFGDLLSLLLQAIDARETISIDMTLGSKRYIFEAAPKGMPLPAHVNTGVYSPSSEGPLDLLTQEQAAQLNELLARLGYATAEALVRDKKWVVHLLADGTIIFESPCKGGAGFEMPKGEGGWLTRAR